MARAGGESPPLAAPDPPQGDPRTPQLELLARAAEMLRATNDDGRSARTIAAGVQGPSTRAARRRSTSSTADYAARSARRSPSRGSLTQRYSSLVLAGSPPLPAASAAPAHAVAPRPAAAKPAAGVLSDLLPEVASGPGEGAEGGALALGVDDPPFRDSESGSMPAPRKTAPWSRVEDELIAEAVARFGCKWGVLAALLPGRTCASVRNRWHRLKSARRATDAVGPAPAAEAAPQDDVAEALAGPWNTPETALVPAAAASAAPTGRRLRLAAGAPSSSGYRCSRCGQPKRGHICTSDPDESDVRAYVAAQERMRRLVDEQVRTGRPAAGSVRGSTAVCPDPHLPTRRGAQAERTAASALATRAGPKRRKP